LPILPAGILDLINVLSDENTPFSELAKIIERFPSITARLIILANSVWSSPSTPVDNLMTACSRLGFNVVRNVSIALAVASPFPIHNCPGFNVSRFLCLSLLTSDIASEIAEVTNKNHLKETARTAGLLHNLGLLWLAAELSVSLQEIFMQNESDHSQSLREICRQSMGFDYAEAGAYLGIEWGLPDSLVDAIAHHYTLEQEFNFEITEDYHDKQDSESSVIVPDNMIPMQGYVIESAHSLLDKNQALAAELFNS